MLLQLALNSASKKWTDFQERGYVAEKHAIRRQEVFTSQHAPEQVQYYSGKQQFLRHGMQYVSKLVQSHGKEMLQHYPQMSSVPSHPRYKTRTNCAALAFGLACTEEGKEVPTQGELALPIKYQPGYMSGLFQSGKLSWRKLSEMKELILADFPGVIFDGLSDSSAPELPPPEGYFEAALYSDTEGSKQDYHFTSKPIHLKRFLEGKSLPVLEIRHKPGSTKLINYDSDGMVHYDFRKMNLDYRVSEQDEMSGFHYIFQFRFFVPYSASTSMHKIFNGLWPIPDSSNNNYDSRENSKYYE